MRLLLPALLMLSACTTTMEGMADAPVDRLYHSAKARSVVAECLLNRVSSDELTPHRDIAEHVTTIGFTGHGMARKPAIYRFTISDDGAGSRIEVRRYSGMNLATAETCF